MKKKITTKNTEITMIKQQMLLMTQNLARVTRAWESTDDKFMKKVYKERIIKYCESYKILLNAVEVLEEGLK